MEENHQKSSERNRIVFFLLIGTPSTFLAEQIFILKSSIFLLGGGLALEFFRPSAHFLSQLCCLGLKDVCDLGHHFKSPTSDQQQHKHIRAV